MTRFFLIRHGSTDAVGHTLAGRTPGVHLDVIGARQSDWLVARLAGTTIAGIYSSPLERTMETAEPLAAHVGVPVQVREGLNEIDFGEWTGRSFHDLEARPHWRQFNRVRSTTRIPGGEHFAEVQARVVAELERIGAAHPESSVAIVSHADTIRTALAYCAGVPIDLFLRLEISPASISVISVTENGPGILCINQTESLPG